MWVGSAEIDLSNKDHKIDMKMVLYGYTGTRR
jgi:hypothetical protein